MGRTYIYIIILFGVGWPYHRHIRILCPSSHQERDEALQPSLINAVDAPESVCVREEDIIQGYLRLLLHSLWYSHGCALTPLEHPMSIYKRKRKKYISLCESYDYIIQILKVIGHPRIGQMTWDSIRYVVTRNSRS